MSEVDFISPSRGKSRSQDRRAVCEVPIYLVQLPGTFSAGGGEEVPSHLVRLVRSLARLREKGRKVQCAESRTFIFDKKKKKFACEGEGLESKQIV
jgi:hypothetical protein